MSPHELYFLKKPNLGHLRVFHNIVYVHVPKEKRRMLDAKPRSVSLPPTQMSIRVISGI